jgi:hypothetical protein
LRRRAAVSAGFVTLATACGFYAASEPADDGVAPDASAESGADTSAPGDAAVDAVDAVDGGDADAAVGSRRVFVTRQSVSGQIVAGVLVGRAAGDAICNDEAMKLGVSGSFVAWLSDSNGNAVDALPADVAFVLGDGSLAFPSKDAIVQGHPPLVPLDRDASGTRLTGDFVWTGTTSFGATSLFTCGNWMSQGGVGRAGTFGDPAGWTDSTSLSCDIAHPLICFQK